MDEEIPSKVEQVLQGAQGNQGAINAQFAIVEEGNDVPVVPLK